MYISWLKIGSLLSLSFFSIVNSEWLFIAYQLRFNDGSLTFTVHIERKDLSYVDYFADFNEKKKKLSYKECLFMPSSF